MWLKVEDVSGQNCRVMNFNIFHLREILLPLMAQEGKTVALQLFSHPPQPLPPNKELHLPVAISVVSLHTAENTETYRGAKQ
jgi:hypothetical protein